MADLPELDPAIHQQTRLRVMTLLYRNRQTPLKGLYETLDLTPGNLDTHASRLEDEGYAERTRVLEPDGFRVVLRITPEGDEAYRAYLADLQAFHDEPVPSETG